MTLLDRALTKAYSRQSVASKATSDGLSTAPTTRGWVPRLRPPSQGAKAALDSSVEFLASSPKDESARSVRTVDGGDGFARGNSIGSTAGAGAPVEGPLPSAPPVSAAPAVAWAWPAICDRLLSFSAGHGLRGLASLLCEMLAERRERSLALTGPGRGAGRSTLLLTLARLLAEEREVRVLAIDLDFGNPQLAQLLGIAPSQDLWQAVCRNVAAAVPLVTLVPDRLSLAPLGNRVSMTDVTVERAAALRGLMQRWRNEFDLLLVDGGPWELFGSLVVRETSTVEACVCVSRFDKSASDAADGERYRQAGMDFLGFVETFAPIDSPLEPPVTR